MSEILTPEERNELDEMLAAVVLPTFTPREREVAVLVAGHLRARYAAERGSCEWRETEDGQWVTACDHMFEFNDGGPVENKQAFCGYCGKRLVEVPREDGRDA